jgi:hypothetical protein
MGYKFVGAGDETYGTSVFYFESEGLTKGIKNGDWVDSEDIAYMLENHPTLIREYPGQGPEPPIIPHLGPTGPQGVPGVTGAQGPQGTSGVDGVAGTQGPQGASGGQGPQGATGSGSEGAAVTPPPTPPADTVVEYTKVTGTSPNKTVARCLKFPDGTEVVIASVVM